MNAEKRKDVLKELCKNYEVNWMPDEMKESFSEVDDNKAFFNGNIWDFNFIEDTPEQKIISVLDDSINTEEYYSDKTTDLWIQLFVGNNTNILKRQELIHWSVCYMNDDEFCEFSILKKYINLQTWLYAPAQLTLFLMYAPRNVRISMINEICESLKEQLFVTQKLLEWKK